MSDFLKITGILKIIFGNPQCKLVPLYEKDVHIGKGKEMDFSIDSDKTQSDHEIKLSFIEKKWHITLLNTTSDTFLDAQALIPNKLYAMRNSSIIYLGHPLEHPVTLMFLKTNISVPAMYAFDEFLLEAAGAIKALDENECYNSITVEIQCLKNAFMHAHILNSLNDEEVRSDFLNGENGALKLKSEQLSHLYEFSKLIGPGLPNELADFNSHFHALAKNHIFLMEGKNKEIVGTTYKELKDLLLSIKECGYFSRPSKSVDKENSNDVIPEEEVLTEQVEDLLAEKDLVYEAAQSSFGKTKTICASTLSIDDQEDYVPDDEILSQQTILVPESGPSPIPEIAQNSSATVTRGNARKSRRVKCNECLACLSKDCEVCINCQEKTKYGGTKKSRKICINRQCLSPYLKPSACCTVCEEVNTSNHIIMECTSCNVIIHPSCFETKYPGFEMDFIINDDKPNSWLCPQCLRNGKPSTKNQDSEVIYFCGEYRSKFKNLVWFGIHQKKNPTHLFCKKSKLEPTKD